MKKTPDKIKEVKVLEFPGATVRVHIPDLTEEERERRMENFKKETEIYMKEVIKARESAGHKGTGAPA